MENRKQDLIKDLDISALSKKELELSTYDGEDRVVLAQELQNELSLTDDSMFRFNTGIKSMDRILDGVECGELIVVTGLTGGGKTTLLMTITNNMAESGVKSCWFTLEVTPRQFLKKMVARGGDLPEFYIPKENKDNTLKWIEERIVESMVKYNSRVVFIDHINAIYSLIQSQGNVSLEIGDLVAKIKSIAIKHNQIIFLIAHCKDPVDSKEPTERSIRDSGLISRYADSILGIWRVRNEVDPNSTVLGSIEEEDTDSKIRIWKNRRSGKLGKFFMRHENHYLTEIEKISEFDKTVKDLKPKQNELYGK